MEATNERTYTTTVKTNKKRPNMSVRYYPVLIKVFSVFLLVVIWWLLSFTLPSTILPGPGLTAKAFLDNISSGALGVHFVATFYRVFFGFLLSMVLGVAVGIPMGLNKPFEQVADVWVMVLLAIPGLVYIIISFMWFGLNDLAAIAAIAITTFPTVAINVWQGVKNIDNKLSDMAKIFKASPRKRLFQVILPQVYPYLMASARFGLGMVWKVTVLVELLGMSSGVGYMLNYWFQMNNMPQVFAWTIFFCIVMTVLEVGVLKPIDKKLFAWRPDVKL